MYKLCELYLLSPVIKIYIIDYTSNLQNKNFGLIAQIPLHWSFLKESFLIIATFAALNSMRKSKFAISFYLLYCIITKSNNIVDIICGKIGFVIVYLIPYCLITREA